MRLIKLCLAGTVMAGWLLSASSQLPAQTRSGALPQLPGQQLPGQQLPGQQLPGQPNPGQPGQAPSSTRPANPAGLAPGMEPRGYISGNSITSVPAAIKCIHDVQLAAQADGLLQELYFEEGAAVEKGQLVLTIDERTAKAELAVAEKEAEAAAAQAAQDANLRFSRKVSEVSDAEYLEIKELYERNSASLSETRRKKLEAEKAKLGIEVAEVDHAKDILAHHVAQEKVAAAKVQVDLRKVIAPYDGIIVERKRDQGEWVKAGEPVLRLVHMKEMRVEANVPVRGAAVAHLQNAQIRLQVMSNGQAIPLEARVEFVSPVIEMNTCRIWGRVPNRIDAGHWLLRDGMEATIDIHFAATQPVSTQNR